MQRQCEYIIVVESFISTDKAEGALTDLPSLLTQNPPPRQPRRHERVFLPNFIKRRDWAWFPLSVVPQGCYQEATWPAGPLEAGVAEPRFNWKPRPQGLHQSGRTLHLPASASWRRGQRGAAVSSTSEGSLGVLLMSDGPLSRKLSPEEAKSQSQKSPGHQGQACSPAGEDDVRS